MIKKLRRKIFWIIQISLSIIIIGVAIIFTTSSYRNIIHSSTMILEKLEGKGEKKDKRFIESDEHQVIKETPPINIEGVYRIRVSNSNIIKESNGVQDEIRKYAIKISNQNDEDGYIDKYIFKVREMVNGEKEISLIENEEAIKKIKVTIIYAIVNSVLGIIVVYIISKNISKLIVSPVEKSFEKQKQFISDASHELKTPLAVIEANVDVLQDKVGENKWITYIKKEVKSMDKLVNDLLVLARMENDNNVNKEIFNLSKEIEMSVAVFESIIYENKIHLENNICDNIYFDGEKEDIKHIISIILDNAIKHTEENNKIVVNLQKEKNNIKIEIKNQGQPIPLEEREKIFERFYRVDKARNRSEKRYGLGLSIAKEIVEKYKGTIKAISEDGFTSFIVTFNCK